MSSLRESILNCARPAAVELPRKYFGQTVFVRRMSALERDQLAQRYADESGNKDFRTSWLVRYGVGDADGKAIFGDADVVRLAALDGVAMSDLAGEIVRVNAMGVAAVDDSAKNSESGPSEG